MQWQHQPVMLATIGRMLRRIAERGVVVVVLNQVVGGPTGSSSDLKPALGRPQNPPAPVSRYQGSNAAPHSTLHGMAAHSKLLWC